MSCILRMRLSVAVRYSKKWGYEAACMLPATEVSGVVGRTSGGSPPHTLPITGMRIGRLLLRAIPSLPKVGRWLISSEQQASPRPGASTIAAGRGEAWRLRLGSLEAVNRKHNRICPNGLPLGRQSYREPRVRQAVVAAQRLLSAVPREMVGLPL